MTKRIRWTPAEINLIADRVAELHTSDPSRSFVTHAKRAQSVLPKTRQRKFTMLSPELTTAIKSRVGSAPAIPKAESPSRLSEFTDEQLVQELGQRMVKKAVRDYVLTLE